MKEVCNGILPSGSGNHIRELIFSIAAIDHSTLVKQINETCS